MRKKVIRCVLLLLLLTGVSACGQDRQESGDSYQIYYVNKEGTRVASEEYVTDTEAGDREALLQEFLAQLKDTADRPEYLSPLSETFQGYMFNEGQMNLDFSELYRNQEIGRAHV